jgi:hypothetical protein
MSSDRIAIAFVALTIVVAPIAGQSPAQIKAEPLVKLKQGDTPVPGQCLSKEQLDLIAALNALHRPTVGLEEGGDDPIPFDPHYLVGSWRIDGFLADSALGDGGEFSGTETVRQNQIDACTYESTLQGKAPDGAFTIKATMAYDPRHQNGACRRRRRRLLRPHLGGSACCTRPQHCPFEGPHADVVARCVPRGDTSLRR